MEIGLKQIKLHCVKIVRIQSFPGSYFPGFELNVRMRENGEQKNSEYGFCYVILEL